ncbi:MAG: efflux RND transporter periplasmic adaptor subunit [Pseudomonadota bacterium]
MSEVTRRFLLPLAILLGGAALAALIIVTGPELEQLPPPANEPLVRVWVATPDTVQLSSSTHGSVVPRTETELVPEVSGRVISISESLTAGGFFSKDEVLLQVDPSDYEIALERAKAAVASAESELDNARKEHQRQLNLADRQSTSESQRDSALNRLRFAEAALRESSAGLRRAELDLERTQLLAPFDGRVRSERVDVGQFISRGAPVASIYATDYAEVRLPLNDRELAFLELPLAGISEADAPQPKVILRANFGGADHQWEGHIVRTEGELDPQTRMINVIAEVADPYSATGARPPLAIGLFVEAEIIGPSLEDIFILPRSALQSNGQIYTVDGNNQLQFRDVEVLRTVGDALYIQSGLTTGERVSLSRVSNAIEGMKVRPISDETGEAS